MFEAEIFTILLFATSEYLKIDFVTGRLKVLLYHLVTFIKHMSIRFIKTQNAAFHLGLYCYLTVISTPNEIKLDINIPDFPKMKMD